MIGVLRKTILLTQALRSFVYEQYSGRFVPPQGPSGSYVSIQFLDFHFSAYNAFSKAFPSRSYLSSFPEFSSSSRFSLEAPAAFGGGGGVCGGANNKRREFAMVRVIDHRSDRGLVHFLMPLFSRNKLFSVNRGKEKRAVGVVQKVLWP